MSDYFSALISHSEDTEKRMEQDGSRVWEYCDGCQGLEQPRTVWGCFASKWKQEPQQHTSLYLFPELPSHPGFWVLRDANQSPKPWSPLRTHLEGIEFSINLKAIFRNVPLVNLLIDTSDVLLCGVFFFFLLYFIFVCFSLWVCFNSSQIDIGLV